MTKRIRHLGAVAKGGLTILAIAALALTATVSVSHFVLPRNQLTTATGFTITSAIDASPACTSTALLYPGVTRCLVYTVHNPLSVPITVSALSILSSTVTTTTQNTRLPACTTSELNLTNSSFSGSLAVPAGSAKTANELISLNDSGNQNNCENAIFNFTYTGSATYTEVYATGTVVMSSLNPSAVGQAVTYTATVTASATASQDAVPNSPTGTVTFKDGTTTICTAVAVSSTGTTTATAKCSPAAYSVGGTHPITAVYSNSDGNFSGSTSPILTQVVGSTTATTKTVLTSIPNPSTYGQSVLLTATVTPASGSTPTGTVSFYLGSPTGTLLGTGTLSGGKATLSTSSLPIGKNSLYASYGGTASDSKSTSSVTTQTVGLSPTSTVLTSNPDPSLFGHAVTLTATVTASTGPIPTGTVTFQRATPSGTVQIGTATLSNGKATLVTSNLPSGSDSLFATYTGSATDQRSVSGAITQSVNFTSSCVTGTVNGGYVVKSGQAVCITGHVNGGVTVQSGGSLFLNGATINGAITSTGATALTFCGSTITGNVTISGTTGYIVIGDDGDDGSPSCAANAITGNVTMSANTGGFELAATAVTGNVSLSANTGEGPTNEAPEVEANKIKGNLACATSNNPALSDGGAKNTVSGTKSGQCSAAGF